MSIVKMKRIRLIALAEERDALLSSLLHVGCVEISEPSEYLADEDYAALLHRDTTDLAQAKGELVELQSALQTLKKYAPRKEGLFAPRPSVSERELLDREQMAVALSKARKINDHAKNLGQLVARETRINAEIMSLRPWEAYELPLSEKGTKQVAVLLGTVPSGVDMDLVRGTVAEAAEESEIRLLSSDREQHCLEILVHRSKEQIALETLRTFGFSFSQLRDLSGTVGENLARLKDELNMLLREREQEVAAITAMGEDTDALQLSVDSIRQKVATETAKENLLTGGAILYLDGWVDEPNVAALEKALTAFECAYELTDPTPEEYPKVPVKLKNNALTRPLNMVTEMYSLPAYDGVDPNPLMAPFFVTFFGMMMADMGYGLAMIIGGWFILNKMKAKGTMAHIGGLGYLCGFSTFVFGALTGGFFGDFIPQLLKLINPESTFALPALFTPLTDTIAILIGSLILGFLQIITGMAISVVRKIQSGDFIDALFDEISWWIVLAGGALAIFGIGNIAGVPVILVIGGLMLAIGGTREAKGFGKVTKLIGIVYNGVSGFFSDTFSYARLMALMLAGSVVASVFNTLGAVTGNVILFVIISLIGNTLNLVLNLLGCYAHDLRLQCLEYFGRFYQEGGKAFNPLKIQTKYVEIIKEEK